MITKMAKTIAISEDVLAILNRSEITDSTLSLPPEQLERTMYDKVMKVISAAGGKWSKGKKCHIFAQDPRAALGMAMESGTIENRQQTYQEFFTPREIAEKLCEDVWPRDRVLEPSAGIGRLAKAAADKNATVFCMELHPQNIVELRKDPRLCAWEGDFLKFSSDWLKPFDVVVMNPPFSGGQDIEHVRHAFEFLKPGGMLIAIVNPMALDGGQKKNKEFKTWLSEVGIVDTEELPAGTFKESGTMVKTLLLRVRKN